MARANQTVFFAKNTADVFYQLKIIPGLQIIGGATGIDTIPDKVLSVRRIPELSIIEKRERFIDFGPAVTLAQILEIGKEKLPSVLYEALKSIATPQIRNMATIGGNICADGRKGTLTAPLLALDTTIELDDTLDTRAIPLLKFDRVPKGWLLAKIRVPVEEWEVAVFRRLGPAHLITDTSAAFTFLANTQKGVLANLRIAFAGPFAFRNLDLENRLIGTRLPIPEKSITDLVAGAAKIFDTDAAPFNLNPILREQFLNLLKFSLEQLT
jgi:xanthine dehydrogenase FAD-binding subunit